MNKAVWGGYTTPDQYLGFLQKERTALASLNDALLARAQIYRDNASAALSYANALAGTHETAGTLGENLDLSGINQFQAALEGLPDVVSTRLDVDDAVALGKIAAYQALLDHIPKEVSTVAVTATATEGGTPLDTSPQVIPVSYGGPYQEQFAAIMGEVAELARLRVQIPVHFDLPSAAEVAAMVSQIPTVGITEPVHLAPEGGAVGVGPGPPPPETVAAFQALAGAEGEAADEGAAAAAAGRAAGDAAAAAVPGIDVAAAAWETLNAAQKEAGGSAADAAVKLHALASAADNSTDAVRLTIAAELADKAAAAQLGDAELAAGAAAGKTAAEVGGLAAAYEKLSAAEKSAAAGVAGGGAGGAGKPPVAAAAAEPPEDAAGKWEALSAAEKNAAADAEDAVAALRQLAVSSASSGDAAKYAYAAQLLQVTVERSVGTSAEGAVAQLAAQAAAARSGGDAARYAYSAQQLLKQALDESGEPAAAAGLAMKKLASSADDASRSSVRLRGWLSALNVELTLFGGLLGSATLIGKISAWHVLLDGVIEVLALWIPALATAAAGLLAWGVAGVESATQIYDRMKAVYTASQATGQVIAPLSDSFSKLADSVRPQVYELFGDALTVMNSRGGVFSSLIKETGGYLESFAARLVVAMQSGGKGFQDFLAIGEKDLALIGKGFDSLGTIIASFVKATALTHIAEDLAAIGDAALAVAADISKMPTPLLAVILGLHAFLLWGGLMTTALTKLIFPIRSVALALGGISRADSALGSLPDKAAAFERLKAALADVGTGFGNLPSRISGTALSLKDISAMVAGTTVPDLAALQAYSAKTGIAMEALVTDAQRAQIGMLSLSNDLGASAQQALYMAAAAGATDEELTAMAGSEALATAGAFSLSGAISTLGKSLLALLTSPITWLVAAAAAIGVLAYKVFTANDNTQQWITGMDAALAKSSNYQVIGKTVSDLAAVTAQLAAAQHGGAGNASELAAAQSDLSGKLQQELVHVGDVSRAYGTDMVGSLELLQTAGVKTDALFTKNNATWAAAMVQVAGLVQGYKAMGQGLTQLQGDVSVQLVVNADQLKSMQTLNQAWDTWLTTVTGGESAVVTFWQNLATTSTNAGAAGASMGGLNAASLTLRSSFLQLIPQAGTVLDQIRQQSAVLQNGADGTAILTRATKDLAAEMIPLAAGNKAAQASILALVQEADPAVNTWQKLTQWVGPLGASGAAADLDKIMTQLEVPVSNLSADAAKLTTALQSDLNPAMAQAEFNALGGQKAFNTFASDLEKFGPSAQPTIDAGKQVAQILLSINKSTPQAHDQFVAWAESMGLSATAAGKLWSQVSAGEKPLASVRDGLAQSSAASDNLDKSGFFAGIKGRYQQSFAEIGQWFGSTMPGFFEKIPGYASAAWGAIWDGPKGFYQDVVLNVDAWFTQSLPHAWDTASHALATGWGTAYNGFQRDLAGPLTAWFTQSLPHAAGTSAAALSTAWGTAWNGFNRDLGGPVEGFFTRTLPRFFTSAGSSFASAASSWWHSFSTDFVGKTEDFFLHLVPGWFAGVDFGPVARKMSGSFSSGFSGPVGNFFTKTVPGFFTSTFSGLWDSTARGMWKDFTSQFGLPSDTFFTKTVPGWLTGTIGPAFSAAWGQSWNGFNRDIISGTDTFFTKTLPGWLSGPVSNAFSTAWGQSWNGFNRYIISGTDTFFTKTLPGWLTGPVSNAFSTAWGQAWNGFNRDIISGTANFFTKTLPAWISAFGVQWYNNVISMWHWFDGNIVHGFTGFFGTDIPNWLSDFGRKWLTNVQHMWTDFYNNVATPMGHWFSQSLPNAVETAFKDSVNWVIDHVINATINFINNDILSHLPGSLHIQDIGHVAAGGDIPAHASGRAIRMPASGSVPGTGDEDGTHIIAMGGEYMLRKPARMALERTYGSNFMNTLNQADQWLGAGSRGNAASQRPPRHAAGGDVGGGAVFPFPAASKYATGGQIAATAEHFIGAPYVYGGTTPAGWDCSGFVQYVLEGLGWHNVPRTSEAQYAWTSHEGSPGVGDLVFAQFPGDNASPGHVGFYIGNGQVLSARDPAEGTGIDALSSWAGHIVGYGHEPNATGVAGQLFGVVTEAWQGIEGLLDAAGDALTGNTAALAGDVAGGAGALLKLAEQGAAAIFGAVWDHSVKPITDLVPGDTIPGAIVQGGAADIRQGIINFMTQQDQAAQSQAASFGTAVGTVPAQSGSAAQAQAFASAHLAQFGWGQDQMPALIALWNKESGWNDNAVNPSSGAYGIPQALPSAQDHPYNLGDYANQVLWGLNYIKQRYGNVGLAWAHELADNWYPMGGVVGGDGASMAVFPGFAQGDVIAAIEGATGNQEIREAMALGSYLESGWSDTAVGDNGTSFGPFQIHLPAHPGVTSSEAENPSWAVSYMLPAYTSGVAQVPSSTWSSDPETAAETAAYYAERPAETYFASHGTAAVNAAWTAVKTALGTSSPVPSASTSTSASSNPLPSGTLAFSGIAVPDIINQKAGAAHNMLVAAGLVPTAAAGQQWYWYATGSNPAPDSPATEGMSVVILADPTATGGPVKVPDVTGYTAGTAHNILVAAGFVPTAAAGQLPWWKVTGTMPAAETVATLGSKVTIAATANIVQVPNLVGYTAGAAHDALVAAGLVPTAAAGQQWYWYVTGTTPAAGTWVAPGSKVTIAASASAPSPGGGAGGAAAAANWPTASAALAPAEAAEVSAFWTLNATPVTGATTDQWAAWYADLGILQANQGSIAGSWNTISPLLSNPAGLTTTDWVDFGTAVASQANWLNDQPTPPSSVWGGETSVPWPSGFRTSAGKAPGQIPPSGWAAWKFAHPQWSAAVSAAQNLKNDELAAYGAWQELWGPAGSVTTAPPTPGLEVLPVGGGPITVNLEPLIPGGPAFPVLAQSGQSLSSTGSGFAAGGRIPLATVPDFAAGGDLGDVAGMFAVGGLIPAGPVAMPAQLASSLAGGSAENPRTMATAAGGSGGDRVGVKIGNLNISNPVPERPSDSITRSTNRLAFLAGRGMA